MLCVGSTEVPTRLSLTTSQCHSPLSQFLPEHVLPVLAAILPEGSTERDDLEALFRPRLQIDDPAEFCCRQASFEAESPPQSGWPNWSWRNT